MQSLLHPTVSSLDVPGQRLLAILLLHALKPSLHRLPYITELSSKNREEEKEKEVGEVVRDTTQWCI
jgi:hypothetical protein